MSYNKLSSLRKDTVCEKCINLDKSLIPQSSQLQERIPKAKFKSIQISIITLLMFLQKYYISYSQLYSQDIYNKQYSYE